MKKFFILSLFVFLTHLVSAQKGTAFLQSGNLKTVFDLAKAQNKPVHLEVYAPTCHVCNAFKPTFENAQVGSLYNQNFINYKLDITSAEGAAFLNKQGIWIPSTPTLLFFDKDVKLMHITVLGENYNTPQALIEAANKAIDPKQRTSNYKASYRSGNRDASFLIEYGFMARIMRDTLDNINVMNNYAKIVPATQYSNNTSFLLLQKVIMDDENNIFEYMISHLGEFNAKYDKNLVKQTAENIIMYSLYSSRGMKYSVAKINQVRANLAKLGVDKKSINGRVWREESTAYFREGQVPKALAVLDSLVDATTDKKSYKFLSNWIKARSSDKAALAKAALWDAKSK